MDDKNLKLRIGDIIYLKSVDESGARWVCAEGHLGENVFLGTSNEEFHYSLWEVHVQNQYTSMSEYEEAYSQQEDLEFGSRDMGITDDEEDDAETDEDEDDINSGTSEDQLMKQLKKAALTEKKLNEKMMANKIGTPVVFGDVIQLRHVASRKFLTISSTMLARHERENMRVLSIANGNSFSCLSIIPRNSMNMSNQHVPNMSDVFIKVNERPGEFLRAAKSLNKTKGNGELNCSLEKTTWSINIYQPCIGIPKAISAGRLVSLSDSETFSFLTVNGDTIDDSNPKESQSQIIVKPPIHVGENSNYFVGVNSLWRIEKKNVHKGGEVRLAHDLVLFCHLSSGQYLHSRLSDGTLMGVRDRHRASEFDLNLITGQDDSSGLSYFLSEGVNINMSTLAGFSLKGLGSSLYVGIENSKGNGAKSDAILGTSTEVNNAMNLIVSNSIQMNYGSDVYFGIETNNFLNDFQRIVNDLSGDDSFDSPKMIQANQTVKSVLTCLDQLCNYLSQENIDLGTGRRKAKRTSNYDKGIGFGLEPDNQATLTARQSMLQEQGLLDTIMAMLKECVSGSFDIVKAASNPRRAVTGGGGRASGSSFAKTKGHDNPMESKGLQGDDGKSKKSMLSNLGSSFIGKFGMNGKSQSTVAEKFHTAQDATDSDSASSSSSSSSSSSDSDSGDERDNRKHKSKPNNNSSMAGMDAAQKQMFGITDEDAVEIVKNPPPSRTGMRRMSNVSAAANGPTSGPKFANPNSANNQVVMHYQGQVMTADMFVKGTNSNEQQQFGNRQGARLSTSDELAQALLRALLPCIQSHSSNQLHISDCLTTLLNHVSKQEYAVLCLHELFRDNQSILQTKIRQSEIDIFVKLLGQSEMNVSFLRLLKETCTCPFGVDSTQRMVALALFGSGKDRENATKSNPTAIVSHSMNHQHKNLIVRMHADKSMARKKDVWVSGKDVYSYFPSANSPEFDPYRTGILGLNLVLDGLPEVYVSWEDSSDTQRMSMLKLYGAPEQVPFSLVCKAYIKDYSIHCRHRILSGTAKGFIERKRRASSHVTSYKKATNRSMSITQKAQNHAMMRKRKQSLSPFDEYKCMVSEYLLQELYLVADLCLDRNYVAIRILESSFDYDMLVTAMRDQDLDRSFKAPLCRILRCLWIDREPQTEAVFPRLIRSSKSTEDDTDGFTKHHKGSPYQFCLLQQTISDYFRKSFDHEHCDDLSEEMAELTLMLMTFGFYSHEDQLRDIVNPLIVGLDHNKRMKNLAAKDKAVNAKENVIHHQQNLSSHIKHEEYSNVSAEDELVSNTARRGSQDKSYFASAVAYFSSHLPTSVGGAKVSPTDGTGRRKSSVSGVPVAIAVDSDDGKHMYKTNRQMEAAKRKLAIEQLENNAMFEAQFLRFTESIAGITLSMFVVFLTVTVSCLQLFDKEHWENVSALDSIDLFCSIFFFSDLLLRGFCVARRDGGAGLPPYFANPLNFIDLLLVALDVILFILGVDGGAGIGAARVSRIVRTIRFVRLVRVVRVLRLVNSISGNGKGGRWVLPERFENVTDNKAKTMTTILKTMEVVYSRIQDNGLERIINAFQNWVELEKTNQIVDPLVVVKKYMGTDENMGLMPAGFDSILVDIIMYSNEELTNQALRLLMLHQNKRHILMSLAKDIQIIYSPKVEAKLEEAKGLLQSLRRGAEMYEIWQNLATEEDNKTADLMTTNIQSMSKLMRKLNDERSLHIKVEFIPDEEVQNLLRNLDAMNCFMTVLDALFDGGREEPPQKVKEIMGLCIEMISYFVQENPRNQQLAYQYMSFFTERIDDGIHSEKAVSAILDRNADLIKSCHKRYVDEFAQKIFANGRKPEYMQVYLALTVDVADYDTAMKSVQNNISRYLTSREWQARILLWCCSPDSTAYSQRAYAMSEYIGESKAIPDEELSSDLLYHINLLTVLSRCNLGPKLQAIYQFDDIVHALVDKSTIFNVKIALGKCLEQLVCNNADTYICSEYIWVFFEYFIDYMQGLQKQIDVLFRRQYSSNVVLMKAQLGDWLNTCLTITTVFFAVLDLQVFGEVIDHDMNVKRTSRTESEIVVLIKKIYNCIRTFIENNFTSIGPVINERANYALVSLCRHTSTISYDYKGPDASRIVKKAQRGSVTLADVQQLQLRHKFILFTEKLQGSMLNNHEESIKFFMSMPDIHAVGEHDVVLEPLINKLVTHIRSCLRTTPTLRTLGSNLEESIWLIRTFRRLFEQILGQTVEYNINIDLELVRSDEKTERWRQIFCEEGLVHLCLDFIAPGVDQTLCLEAINLLVVLLAERGGSVIVQSTVFKYLKDNDSSLFFKHTKEILSESFSWFQKEAENAATIDEEMETLIVMPDENVIFTLIQLMCEGDYLPLKNYMRQQDENTETVNIPVILSTILDFLSRRESPLFTHVSNYVVKTIRQMLHGPCRENQKCLVMTTELLVSLNRLVRLSRPKTQDLTNAWNVDIEQLKESIIDLLRSLSEGFLKSSTIYDKIINNIELNILSVLLMPGPAEDQELLEYGFTALEAKYMVLLSGLDPKGATDNLSPGCLIKMKESISCVEVRWQNDTHKLFFHKPKIIEDLTHDYLKHFDDLDGTSQEDKLMQFLGKIKEFYREAKHQQRLKQYGLSYLWSRRTLISWIMFGVGVILNFLLLEYYVRDNNHVVHFTEEIEDTFHVLIILHIILSVTMALIYITVRMPSHFVSNLETGHTTQESLIRTFLDPMPWWYLATVTCSILAYNTDVIFCCVFMLEWTVLDGTTMYLLRAIYSPFRQLVATLVLLVIVIHIFSSVYFTVYAYDMDHNHVEKFYDLFSSLKLALTYGLRGEYGLDHELDETLGSRMILDLTFYFVVLATLRHIFFAIIVETFGQLREMKNERDEKLHNSCFICGVERHNFEKADVNITFHQHRDHDHKVENYVHFIFAVLEQPLHEDLGIEGFVRKCIKNMDISWIPIGMDAFYYESLVSKVYDVDTNDGKYDIQRIDTDGESDDHEVTRVDSEMNESNGNALTGAASTRPSSPNETRTGGDQKGINMRLGASSSSIGPNMGELMQAIGNINNAVANIGQRLENIEHNSSSSGASHSHLQRQSSGGLVSAGGGGGFASTTAVVYRQPVPSAQIANNQLKGPAEALLSTFESTPSTEHATEAAKAIVAAALSTSMSSESATAATAKSVPAEAEKVDEDEK